MKKSDIALPEILFTAGEGGRISKAVSRLVRQGRARKIAPKVYTTNLQDAPEAIVARHVFEIAGRLFPQAVVSHRTALEGRPATDGSLYLTYKHSRKVDLPGHVVHLMRGPGAQADDRPFIGGLYISSEPRAMLENLASARSRRGVGKAVSRVDLEDRLDRICRIRGEQALNEIREEARRIARALGWQREFDRLDRLVGAILGMRDARKLASPAARAGAGVAVR